MERSSSFSSPAAIADTAVATNERYLHHVTLTTGHTRRSWRHEIAPEILPQLQELVAAARRAGGVRLPGIQPACRLAITDTARCALCSVRTSIPRSQARRCPSPP
jgi:hypothetical protein